MRKRLNLLIMVAFLMLNTASWAQTPTKLVYQHRFDDKPKTKYMVYSNQKVKLEIDTLEYTGKLVILSEDSVALDSHRWHVDQIDGITHKPRSKNWAPIICAGIGIVFIKTSAAIIRRNPNNFIAQYNGTLVLYTGAGLIGTSGALVWGNIRREEYMNLNYFKRVSLPKS